MDDREIKQLRKAVFQQMKIAKKRLENASFILQREVKVDAVPLLFKAVDTTVRILLAFKQKPLGNFQKNIKALEEEYKQEGLFDNETRELFSSICNLNENYMRETQPGHGDRTVKKDFEKAENFLNRTYEFFKAELQTPRERMMKRRAGKILHSGGIFIGLLIFVFVLIKLGLNIFGPEHGLLAGYYNNINLEGPPTVEKIDKRIDFMWNIRTPHPKITSKEFSARWEGKLKIERSGKYTFHVLTDEGVRLFLNDKMIVDTWSDPTRTMENLSAQMKLRKGFHKIKLEYYFNQQFADIQLLWSCDSFKKRLVESKVLYPLAGGIMQNSN